jgi:hypothetical protein
MDDKDVLSMPVCSHAVLTLLPPAGPRLRCRHCHLTLSAQELGSGCCPECREQLKVQRRDFEEVPSDSEGRTRYCCEACGMILDI